MLFREIIAVCCVNLTKHKNTLCGNNSEFLYVKSGGTYNNHWAIIIQNSELSLTTEQIGLQVTLCTWIEEMLGLNAGRDTCYPD
jgi:hypothetical protein